MYKAIWLPAIMAAVVGAQDAGWQPINCPPGPLRLSQRFELLQGLDVPLSQWQAFTHGQSAPATVTVEASAGPDGSPALRVDYEFKGDRDLEYIDIGPDLLLDKPVEGAGFALQVKESAGLPVRARVVDASGETHQFDLSRERGHGWCAAGFALDQQSGFWGGDGNGRLDYPCRLRSILFDRASQGYQAKGALWVASVSHARAVERKGTLVVESRQLPFGNLFRPGDTVHLRLRSGTTLLRWSWSDYWGTDLGHGEGAGAGAETTLALPAPGHYTCTIEAIRERDPVEVVVYRCAALPALPADAPANGVVGFTCHFGQNLAYPLACMGLYKEYGFGRFRDEISWRSVETQRGQYALPPHALAWTTKARELGMHPLLILDYNNPSYDNDGFPNSAEAIQGFAGYATYMATTLAATIDEFEVWNEWVGACGMGGQPGDHGPEAYGRLLKAVYPAIKQARPAATVVGIGGEYGPQVIETVERMVKSAGGNAMDAFSIHPYRYPRTPEESGLSAELCRIAERTAAAGAPRRQWITEIGWPTHSTAGGVDEPTQAQLLVRSLALMQGSGAVDRIYLYDFKNDGAKPDYNEHNFGVVLHQEFNCAPKPAAVAVAVYARLTAGGKVLQQGEGEGAHAVLFGLPAGGQLLLLWTTGATASLDVAGSLDGQTDLMGRASPASRRVTVSANPVYLRGQHLDVPSLHLTAVP
jgi:hypothetical protein